MAYSSTSTLRYFANAFSKTLRDMYTINVGPNKINSAAKNMLLNMPTSITAVKITVTSVYGANMKENMNALKKISLALPTKVTITG